MAGPYYLAINTATPTFSDPVFLDSGDRDVAVEVPSLAAGGELRPQFSSTSGGPFWTLQRYDGSGAPFTAYSGSAPGIFVITPPTPFARFAFTTSVTVIKTLTLYPTR